MPTYNGALRVEKPPLVNWIQIVGVSLFGRNEFGVRIGSVCLTIGTCLLTWWIGRLLAGPFAGLLSGLVMSTCIWTAVGGRAATPDAALVFCTTMAGAFYVHAIQRDSVLQITRLHAVGIGLACGLAVLAKVLLVSFYQWRHFCSLHAYCTTNLFSRVANLGFITL